MEQRFSQYDTYAVSVNLEQQNRNRIAWREFMETGSAKVPPVPEVYAAWRRCRDMGINPQQKSVTEGLSPDELEKSREGHRSLLDIGIPVLQNLFGFVANSGFNVALSDGTGHILEVFGDDVALTQAKAGNWREGADWSERSAGNNVIGTSIFLKKPVMIIGYEHFCRCSHHWAAAGAPIKTGGGEILGAVAICGPFEKIHAHTLGMVVAAVESIEKQFSLMEAWHECDMAGLYKDKIIDSITDGVIGTNRDNRIIFCNRVACDLLGIAEDRLRTMALGEIMEQKWVEILTGAANGVMDKELILKAGTRYVQCICTSQHITNGGARDGMVIVLREYTRAEKLANKLLMKDAKWTFDTMIGQSSAYVSMLQMARAASNSDSNILIYGESGTGKDLIAQSIHNASSRRNGPYIAINCGAIPKDLINSELFGYSEGAFTGAKRGGSPGKFQLANGGTLFLDEIGEMPLEQQRVFLRVLEERCITQVGSSTRIPVDVRIIAATNKNLYQSVQEYSFRQDLFYRLNVFTVRTVPLRDRKEDIGALANAHLEKLALRGDGRWCPLDEETLRLLREYNWPGNVRELNNVIERAYIMSGGGEITPGLVHSILREAEIAGSYHAADAPAGEEREAALIRSLLRENRGNVTKTCLSLGISRTTFYRKVGKYGIEITR